MNPEIPTGRDWVWTRLVAALVVAYAGGVTVIIAATWLPAGDPRTTIERLLLLGSLISAAGILALHLLSLRDHQIRVPKLPAKPGRHRKQVRSHSQAKRHAGKAIGLVIMTPADDLEGRTCAIPTDSRVRTAMRERNAQSVNERRWS